MPYLGFLLCVGLDRIRMEEVEEEEAEKEEDDLDDVEEWKSKMGRLSKTDVVSRQKGRKEGRRSRRRELSLTCA